MKATTSTATPHVTRKGLCLVATALCSAALLPMAAKAAWPYDTIDKVDVDPMETLVSNWRPAPFDRKAKVLLFSECFGYNHHGGRCYGNHLFRRAGEVYGTWEVCQETNPARLGDAAYLAAFDALILNNSTRITETNAPGVTVALTNFLAQGKGIAIFHAGLDSFKDSEVLQKTFGGFFKGHPWHEDGTWKFKVEEMNHPLVAPFGELGATFYKADEIYQFLRHFDRASCKVLISLDLSDPVTKRAEMWWGKHFGPGSTRADHDYGVSWIKKVGAGRVFYTSFGHDRGAYLDAPRAYHMLLGVQYALGDVAY